MRVFSDPRVTRRAGLGLIAVAAVWHATRFDFFADDAYIALRYAKNLLQFHELAYNPGERVEGFTSPLWVLLLALGGLSKASLVSVARALGGAACVASIAATAELWDEFEPEAPALFVLAPAALLAYSVPFAAWSLGGLETPLFVALYTWTLALVARAARVRSLRSFFWLGLVGSLATLCRPEATVLLALSAPVVVLSAARTPRAFVKLAAWAAPICVLIGGYEVFRLAYYGYPLPNTFYVKTSGDLWPHGVQYLAFAAGELSWVWVSALAIAAPAVFLLVRARRARWDAQRGALLGPAVAIVAIAVQLVYIARVGGDFLDLYRFIAPILPALFCLVGAALLRAWSRFGGRAQIPLQITALGLAYAWISPRASLTAEALTVNAASRRPLHLEPLGWTRLYGRRWAGIGRFLARIRVPSDTMAMGAAGAAPFFSGMPNLDLFGLNDAEIAHHGWVVGNRPGHQRFASTEYLLSKHPTFILMYPEQTPESSRPLRSDPFWARNGYLPAEMNVDASLCEGEAGFYHQFLVRSDRAASLRAQGVRVGADERR
jgi:hypothetical protein